MSIENIKNEIIDPIKYPEQAELIDKNPQLLQIIELVLKKEPEFLATLKYAMKTTSEIETTNTKIYNLKNTIV